MVVCMFSICLFFACCRWNCSPLPLFSTHFGSLCAFIWICLFVFFTFSFNLLSFLFFDYCVHTVTMQCILLTHSLKEGPCWQLGHSLSPSGCVLSCQREKLKQYLSSFAFLFFYCGNPEHTEWTLRYWALLLSRITICNVFPCDVTVNNFSAKGNKSVDFGVVFVLRFFDF